MKIKSIRLNNIKSHKDTILSFGNGINIIAGHNGSGKTTVIEAIETVLFKEKPSKGGQLASLVRKGQKQGKIEIETESNGLEYKIIAHIDYRKNRTSVYSFSILDSKGMPIVDNDYSFIQKNILRFNDEETPETVFKGIIGSKQGSFHEIFSSSKTEERRKTFDKILKLYRFEEMKKRIRDVLNTSAKTKIEKLETKIEGIESRIGEFDENLEGKIEEKEAYIKELGNNILILKNNILELEKLEQSVTNLINNKDRLVNNISVTKENAENYQSQVEDLVEGLEKARQSTLFITEHQSDYELYIRLGSELEYLEKEKKNLEGYKAEKSELESRQSKHMSNKEHKIEQKQSLIEALNQGQDSIENKQSLIAELSATLGELGQSLSESKQKLALIDGELVKLQGLKTRRENLYRYISTQNEKILYEKEGIKSIDLLDEGELKKLETEAQEKDFLEKGLNDKEKQQEINKVQIDNKIREINSIAQSIDEITENLIYNEKQKEDLGKELESLHVYKSFLEENQEAYNKYLHLKNEINEIEEQKSILENYKSKKTNIENTKKNLSIKKESYLSQVENLELEIDKLKNELQEKDSLAMGYKQRLEVLNEYLIEHITLLEDIEHIIKNIEENKMEKKYKLSSLKLLTEAVQENRRKLDELSPLINQEKGEDLQKRLRHRDELRSILQNLENKIEINNNKIANKHDMGEKINANQCPIFDTKCPLSEKQDLSNAMGGLIAEITHQQAELEKEKKILIEDLSSLNDVEQELREYQELSYKHQNIQDDLSNLLKDFWASINSIYKEETVFTKVKNLLDKVIQSSNLMHTSMKQSINEGLENLKAYQGDVIQLEQDYSNVDVVLGFLEDDVVATSKLYDDLSNVQTELRSAVAEKNSDKTTVETELKNVNLRVSDITEQLHDKDQVLNAHRKDVKSISESISKQDVLISEICEAYSPEELEAVSKTLDAKKSMEKSLSGIYEDYLRKEASLKDYPKKEKNLEDTKSSIINMEKKKQAFEQSVKQLKTEIRFLEEENVKINESVDELKLRLEKSNTANSDLKVYKEKTSKVEAMKRNVEQYLSDIWGSINSYYGEDYDWEGLESLLVDAVDSDKVSNLIISYGDIVSVISQLKTKSSSISDVGEIRNQIDNEILNLEQIEGFVSQYKDKLSNRFSETNSELVGNQTMIQSAKQSIDEIQVSIEEKQALLASVEKELAITDSYIYEVGTKLDSIGKLFSEEIYSKVIKDFETKKVRRKNLIPVYEKFIREKNIAETLPEKEEKLNEIKMKIKEIEDILTTKNKELFRVESELSKHDIEEYQQSLKFKRNEEKKLIGIKNRVETELETYVNDLKRYKKKQKELKYEKSQLKQYKNTENILRKISSDVLAQTSSALSKELINNISYRADKIYRKIAPTENRRLVWCYNDKDIYTLKLQSRTNPDSIIDVKNLSGGQLMSASIALRLALISMFPDLGIGFLDEPTVFLDKDRRVNLAKTITQNLISTYIGNKDWIEQLFIITHDDSFSNLGANEVLLRLNDDNISQIVEF